MQGVNLEDFEALESVQSQCILDDVARSQGPGEDMDPISLIVPRELAEILSQPVAVEKLREAIGDRSCSEDEDLGNKVSEGLPETDLLRGIADAPNPNVTENKTLRELQ